MHLSREQILGAEDAAFEDVSVPEWAPKGAKKPDQVFVRVKALSGAERDRFEASITERKGRKTRTNLANVRARLVTLAAVDMDGKPLFAPADVEALGQRSAAALDRVFSAAMVLAGLRDEDIDELTENFTDDLNGASTTN